MNYYLPRYDLTMVLGYTGPGLSFYRRDRTMNNLYGSQKNYQQNVLSGAVDEPYHYLFGAATKYLYHKRE